MSEGVENFKGTYQDLCQKIQDLAPKQVVVDFSAHWCPPCRRLAELLPSLADSHPNIHFLKVNIDESKELSAHFGISSIPHLIFFRVSGEQKDQITEWGSVIGADIQQIKANLIQFTAY